MSIRGDAAIAMLETGHHDEAVVLLTPIINDPHGGPSAEWARRLLSQIEQSRARVGSD